MVYLHFDCIALGSSFTRGCSQTTLTSFWLFLTTYHPLHLQMYIDFSFPIFNSSFFSLEMATFLLHCKRPRAMLTIKISIIDCQYWLERCTLVRKVEKILKGSLDLISSPSPSMKIQIMCGKVV